MDVTDINSVRREKALNELIDAARRYAYCEDAWRTDDSGKSDVEDRLLDEARDAEKRLQLAAKELYRCEAWL